MSFYRDYVYPYLVDILGDPAPILKVRQQIIPLAQGKVLEIGAGSGANFLHYDITKVNKLYALEPNPGMIHLAVLISIGCDWFDVACVRVDAALDVSRWLFGMKPIKKEIAVASNAKLERQPL